MYRFPDGFSLETYSQPTNTLEGPQASIQLRSIRKTFKNSEAYTVPCDILFIPLLGKKIFYTQGEAFPIEAGEILFIRKDAPLSCDLVRLDQERFEAIMFHLEHDFISSLIKKYTLDLPKAPVQPQNLSKIKVTPLLKNSIESLLPLYVHTPRNIEALTQLKMEEVILNLLESDPEEVDVFRNLLASTTDPQHQIYLELIETCLSTPLSVADMAQKLHKSPSAFKKEFKQFFQVSPAQFMLEKRLERARQMLIKSDESITQVGLKCGFESTSHFIQCFKKKCNMTPGQLRKSKSDIL